MKNFGDGFTVPWNKAGIANEPSGGSDMKEWKFGRLTPCKPLVQGILTLVIAGASALWHAPASSAQTVTVGGSMEGNLAINPGDTILTGYDINMPGMHSAATVTVSGGMVQMNVVCLDGSAETVTMTLPVQSYSVPSNDNSWYPSTDPSSPLVYQGTAKAPLNLCGGLRGFAPNGVSFTAIFQSTDNSDPLDARFHYSDKSAGSWSATVHCIKPPKFGPRSQTPVFGRGVIVDHQRIDGDPSLAIDGTDRIYVAGPFGFSTTASYVWRSTDHGKSFHLVPGNLAPYGKPLVTCVGGGDSALAIDS